ncbi:hypothetical protein CLHUN_27900 [Ruminiclostridium hungatei]|uniref:Lipoprotein n=1 Tax=Ruminiclostridium hungatei TaxID=48256 RepID=A0A1V4SH30_RUMHU|nr:hypothetical protein [Ruminiclostridium hungatei]OPX43242.1 hypothetical protein CLHUN_27900 [Ruminiclostridium hungatei]
MKKIISISAMILVLTSIVTGCAKSNKTPADAGSSVTAYGITAEVSEVFDDYCKVEVTEKDNNFAKNDIITVYYNSIYRESDEISEDAKDIKKTEKVDTLNKGDSTAITYFKFKKEKAGNFIFDSNILIIN